LDNDEEQKLPPGPRVLAAIQAALAEPRTLKVVFGYARKRAFLLAKAGVGVDVDPDDLVNQVIVDTVRGRLTWNPDAVVLSTHFCGAIRARTSKLLTRRKPAAPEEEIDQMLDARAPDVDPTEEFAALRELVRRVKTHLFQAATAKNDEGVQLLLMAYEEGVEGRSAIGDATGLSPNDVTNARKRLDRLIGKLPPELVEAACKVMN
jgi:hypothetical protein